MAGSTAGSFGVARAGMLDAGKAPQAPTVTGRDVTVAWDQNSPAFLGGPLGADANGGYLIKRYAEGGGDAITPGGSCSGIQTGAGDALFCTETGLPTGRWKYTVTPTYYDWLGDESGLSVGRGRRAGCTDVCDVHERARPGRRVRQRHQHADVHVDVALPATSLSSDTVHLTVSDGSDPTVTASLSATAGAGSVSFTGMDVSGLDDGSLTFTVKATSSYGDDSTSTSGSYTKDTVDPAVIVTPGRSADSNGWYNQAVVFSASTARTRAAAASSPADPDSSYSGPDGTG